MLTTNDRMQYAAVIMFTFYAAENIMHPFTLFFIQCDWWAEHDTHSPSSSCIAAAFEHHQHSPSVSMAV